MRARSGAAEVPAMVLGAGLNGLGVIRSLARAGVPVIAVDDNMNRPAMRTRYGRKMQVRKLHGEALVEDLVGIARLFRERPVLFLTEEATVRTVSAHRDRLDPFYRLMLPAANVLDALMHKESFQRLASRHGFRVPESVRVVDDCGLKAAYALRYPVILKPGKKDAAYARSFRKAYRVENFEALCQLCRQIMPVLPDLIAQEWVDGSDADVYFCLQYVKPDGTPAASFSGRKIRSWPPAVGGTASCMPAPEAAAEIDAQTTRFFNAVGFTGMGSMEYKRHAKTGAFYLIEPTVARTDYQEEIATLNGVNIPLAAWLVQLGRECPPVAAVPPKIWRESAVDRYSAELQNQVCGRGPLDSGAKVDAWWRWYDPLPWLTLMQARVLKAGRRRLSFRQLGMPKGERA